MIRILAFLAAPKVICAVTVLLGFSACASSGSDSADSDPAAVYGKNWRVTQIEAMEVPFDAGLLFSISEGRMTGDSGVNRFNGNAILGADGSFEAGPLAMTRMAGPPEAMDRETLLLVALERADGWRLSDGAFSLLVGDGVLLIALPAE